MLTIHAGMAKTGTTALQAELHSNRSSLRESGIAYPSEFCDAEGIAHHALPAALLESSKAKSPLIESFMVYLENEPAPRVLISSEAFGNALAPRHVETFSHFLMRLRARRPVRLVVALRRVDSFFESMYLHSIKVGELNLDFSSYLMRRRNWMPNLLRGLARVHQALGENSLAYVKYRSDPAYRLEFYEKTGVPVPALARPLGKALRNPRLGLKAQTALRFLPQIEKDVGRSLPRGRLISAFESGRLSFSDDIFRYNLMDHREALQLHDATIATSLACGETAYADYFAGDEIPPQTACQLEYGLLTSEDIERLVAYAGTPSPPSSKS